MNARAFATVFAIAIFSCGCSRSHAPKPSAANESRVQRIVSLSPSTTEALFAIGAGKSLVGRSRYCDDPKEVLALPQVGGYVDPNVEAILSLTPDLVIGARGPSGSQIETTLASHGIATYFPETESLSAIDTMILGLGDRTLHANQAKIAVVREHANLATIDRALAGKRPVRALLVFGLDPLVVAGPSSFANEMLTRAGGTNVVTEGPAYPMLELERVLILDPDLILNAAMAEAHGAERIVATAPGWRDVRAVKEGHVAAITDEHVLRPGPHVDEGIRTIARALHPDVTIAF
jgi:iron complex transport system substrate-binding protein